MAWAHHSMLLTIPDLSFYLGELIVIFNTPYDTTAGKLIDLRVLYKHLKEIVIMSGPYLTNFNIRKVGDIEPVFITGSTTQESTLPHFSHPLYIKSSNSIEHLFIDVRPFMRNLKGIDLGELNMSHVRALTDFTLAKSRLILTLAWLNNSQQNMKNDLNFAGEVYAKWLAESISRKYGLDAKDQLIITIVCHYYWQSLFTNDINEYIKEQFISKTLNMTKAPSSLVFDTYDKSGDMTDVHSLCKAIVKSTENIRLNDLNLGIILSIIANNWYGYDARELLSVTIEHPPTWFSIVYSSMTERSYKNSMIAKLVEKLAKQGKGDEFVKSYASYVSSVENSISSEEVVIHDFPGV